MPSTIYELQDRYRNEHRAKFLKLHSNATIWNGRHHVPKFKYGPIAQKFIVRTKGRACNVHMRLLRLGLNSNVYCKHHIES